MKGRQHGSSLIEVLVALLVVALGLMGAAAMQWGGLRGVHHASLRTTATLIADDIIERMRANTAGARVGAYDGLDTDAPPAAQDCSAATCSPLQMADSDGHQWAVHLNNLDGHPDFVPALPQGRGRVERNGDQYRIRIDWIEQEEGANRRVEFSTSVRL